MNRCGRYKPVRQTALAHFAIFFCRLCSVAGDYSM
jgi:hypothetical protein